MKIKKVLGTFSETKDGKKFIIKSGKRAGQPYQKQSVVFAEYGDTIFSIPVFDGKLFEDGDDVKGMAGEIREFNGKKYGDWQFPESEKKRLERENEEMKKKLAALEGK